MYIKEQKCILECLLLSDGQSEGWNGHQSNGIGYLRIPHYFVTPIGEPKYSNFNQVTTFLNIDNPMNFKIFFLFIL